MERHEIRLHRRGVVQGAGGDSSGSTFPDLRPSLLSLLQFDYRRTEEFPAYALKSANHSQAQDHVGRALHSARRGTWQARSLQRAPADSRVASGRPQRT